MVNSYVFVISDLVNSSKTEWDASVLLAIADRISLLFSTNDNRFETSVSQGDTVQLFYSGELGLYPAILLFLELKKVTPQGARMAIGMGTAVDSLSVSLPIRQGKLLTTTGHAINKIKQEAKNLIIIDTDEPNGKVNPIWNALGSLLVRHLDELTRVQVEILLSRMWNSHQTQSELAKELGKNQSVVSRHLQAAWHKEINSVIEASQVYISKIK